MTDNPLAGYFRKPAIHMTLPSGGNFYPPGSLEMPATGELPVYPMNALDEITYKTPDALFNGSAIIEVIKSCVPAIKDPWQVASIDLPAILANIRIASFGHMMEIDTQCPNCNELATYEIDLRNIIDNMQTPDYTVPKSFGDLEVFFKPLTYKQVNESGKLNFEEQNLQRTLADKDIEEDVKLKLMSEAFKKISEFTLETVANNVGLIRTPDTDVSDPAYILDYLKNCDRMIYKAVKEHVLKQREMSEIKPIQITCDNKECGLEYEQPFTMDMTSFFE